jgi:uncharacterized protein (DUF983 family)
MGVTRAQIVRNGLLCRCPNCGQRTLFVKDRLFKVNEACPNCGLKIEKGDGAFLGPFVINYTVTAFCFVIPVILLHVSGRLGDRATLALALVAGFLVPILLYRVSWGWWLAVYYFFLPDNVPGNLAGRAEDDE